MNRISRRFSTPVAGIALLTLFAAAAATEGGRIEADGRYWKYGGGRVLLLGGWNHGHNPFIDHDTDNDRDNQGVSAVEQITAAMDEMAAAGGNYLRCVLNPGMASAVQGFPFCAKEGDRYNLEAMEGPFWERLAMFVSEAEKRNIIVQIELWDRFDLIDGSWGSWPGSPWNPKNNINYTADESGLETSYRSFQNHPFLKGVPGHPAYEGAPAERKRQFDTVRRYQELFADRLLSITFEHGNVLYCMNNETHEDPAWGWYWMQYIENAAAARNLGVETTDMFDDMYRAADSRGVDAILSNRDRYDYVDISQANSRHRDEDHWNAVNWLAETLGSADPPYLLHMTKLYGNDLALDGKPWSGFKPGDSDNAIEEWWRNLLAGVAGVRFHRPTAGIGLCGASKNCIKATRLVETLAKFWDVEADQSLLRDREPDEAYIAADPGKAYILYFTQNGGGSVGLDLSAHPETGFTLRWINITRGELGPSAELKGGGTVSLNRPNGDAHWAAAIVGNSR